MIGLKRQKYRMQSVIVFQGAKLSNLRDKSIVPKGFICAQGQVILSRSDVILRRMISTFWGYHTQRIIILKGLGQVSSFRTKGFKLYSKN